MTRRFRNILGAWAVLGLFMALTPAFAEELLTGDSLSALSGSLELCHDPAIAADGQNASACWTAVVDGRKRVYAASYADGAWSSPQPIDDSEEGDCADSIVRYSPQGQPGFAWIQTVGDMCGIVFFSGGEPELIASSPLRMETPSLAYDASGQPFIAWSEGGGGKFAVMGARRSVEGEWQTSVLSAGLDAYDILPAAMGGHTARIYWYSLSDTDFRLAASEWDGRDWARISTGMLNILPANRLPYLYDTQTTLGPGAVWVEPLSGGELVLTADPRWAMGGGFVQPVPGDDGNRQVEPDATSDASEPAFAWREESSSSSDIVVLSANGLTRITGIPHMSQPRLAGGQGDDLHLVFVSDQVEGGTGKIYWVLTD